MKLLNGATLRTLQFGSIVLATSALVACGGSGDSPGATVSGTAAVGVAMANASIVLTCKNGTGSATANASGAYSATFKFDGPCAITATGGAITIHSFAAGAGTYNVTPLTELLLDYLAGQLGTTVSGLLAGITSNPSYQSALSNSTVIANAQAAVVTLIKNTYGITLSSSSFLTVSFTPGQPGADADLDTLQTAGAITANGQPAASLTAAAIAAGAAAPISGGGSGGGATGGTGGTGGTGTTTK
ncbi:MULTISPECIES: carboxypeptidase regulatory-like domain-containing protein [Paraburkholderia]|uniref:carboxypeptidase regulatory-like domain-containing protein n=1 Tax=Paraburkholderia TaxID=1822464 RepID=UPI0022535282|nr:MULTISPECIES: carboxypeptidase regulatory-like domain-containing protein [Paraburkholderia]MCX4175792.1 carboxypeptidase regulatory-like domain-containing protein [Paraburkholderia madseniana]MDQ6463787.1 carboxypeptidase regulatory-like domain-containing protein [Paraburkholderia madseniana]